MSAIPPLAAFALFAADAFGCAVGALDPDVAFFAAGFACEPALFAVAAAPLFALDVAFFAAGFACEPALFAVAAAPVFDPDPPLVPEPDCEPAAVRARAMHPPSSAVDRGLAPWFVRRCPRAAAVGNRPDDGRKVDTMAEAEEPQQELDENEEPQAEGAELDGTAEGDSESSGGEGPSTLKSAAVGAAAGAAVGAAAGAAAGAARSIVSSSGGDEGDEQDGGEGEQAEQEEADEAQ
jgi:hypothetical protein